MHQLCLVAMCKSASAEINRSDNIQGWSSTRTRGGLSYVNLTHHVHDLLESQAKLQDHRVGLIGHRPLQSLVLGHQVVDESPLVGPAHDYYKHQSWLLMASIQRDAFKVIYTNGSIFIIQSFHKNLLRVRLYPNTQTWL